jgi:hypothetical protein
VPLGCSRLLGAPCARTVPRCPPPSSPRLPRPPPFPPPGALSTAAATVNTVNDATTDNAGPSDPLIGDNSAGSTAASTDAASLSFTLTPKINGKLV